MRFKLFQDSETKRRKRLAQQGLQEMRALDRARYPLGVLFDKAFASGNVERLAGETWSDAIARRFSIDLSQLAEFAAGVIATGHYKTSSDLKPTNSELLHYFRGWACCLIEAEKAIAAGSTTLP